MLILVTAGFGYAPKIFQMVVILGYLYLDKRYSHLAQFLEKAEMGRRIVHQKQVYYGSPMNPGYEKG